MTRSELEFPGGPYRLTPFRWQPSLGIEIAVEVSRPRPSLLRLLYRIGGAVGGLLVPAPAEPARANELWEHMCCEAFLRVEGEGERYYEFNLSPSGQWQAYRFEIPRKRRSDLLMAPPGIGMAKTPGHIALGADLDLGALPADRPWKLGLSAVIEPVDGDLCYWALAHPGEEPDFHRRDCHLIELPAAIAA
jgi:hypothetical protein